MALKWWNEPQHGKTNKVTVRPAKTQISLGIRSVWSESSLSAWRYPGSLATHWAHSEDSDQTGRMPRLIWVFTGRTPILLVLSCRGSNLMENISACHVFELLVEIRVPRDTVWASKTCWVMANDDIESTVRKVSLCHYSPAYDSAYTALKCQDLNLFYFGNFLSAKKYSCHCCAHPPGIIKIDSDTAFIDSELYNWDSANVLLENTSILSMMWGCIGKF